MSECLSVRAKAQNSGERKGSLKRLVADLDLDKIILEELASENIDTLRGSSCIRRVERRCRCQNGELAKVFSRARSPQRYVSRRADEVRLTDLVMELATQ